MSLGARPPLWLAGPGGFEPFLGAFADDVGEHLVHGADYVEQEPSSWSGGVDVLLQHDEIDAVPVEPGGNLGQVPHGARHAGQAGNDQLVIGAQMVEAIVLLRPVGETTGDGISPHACTTRVVQSVELGVVALRAATHPRIPVACHRRSVSQRSTHCCSDTLFAHTACHPL